MLFSYTHHQRCHPVCVCIHLHYMPVCVVVGEKYGLWGFCWSSCVMFMMGQKRERDDNVHSLYRSPSKTHPLLSLLFITQTHSETHTLQPLKRYLQAHTHSLINDTNAFTPSVFQHTHTHTTHSLLHANRHLYCLINDIHSLLNYTHSRAPTDRKCSCSCFFLLF